jgi:hypothetical protein
MIINGEILPRVEDRIIRLENQVAALSAKVTRINDRLGLDREERTVTVRCDETATDHGQALDRHSIGLGLMVIGAMLMMYGVLKFLDGTSLSAGQRLGISIAASVLISTVSFFIMRRSSRTSETPKHQLSGAASSTSPKRVA